MKFLYSLFLLLVVTASGQTKNAQNYQNNQTMNTEKISIHQFTVNDIEGNHLNLNH